MSLSRPQAGASANTTSVSISSTSQGDLILVFAFNGTNNTIPTLPSGFTSLATATTANTAARLGYKKSTGGDTSSGTWTSATQVACIVFRSSTGYAMAGAVATATGTGTTLTYPGMTPANSAGNFRNSGSWVAGFGGGASMTAGMDGSTANLTNETSQTKVNGLDSEAVKTSFADETLSVTTSGQWITATVEILETGGELSGNEDFGVQNLNQARQGVVPGHFRHVNLPGDWKGMFAGILGVILGSTTGAAGGDRGKDKVALGTEGISFGLAGLGQHKRTDVGSPTQPCHLQQGAGRFLMLIPLAAGAHTLTIDARFYPDSGSGQRPRLLAKRNLDIGVQADVSAEAGAGGGTDFVTITLNVTTAQAGVLELYREQQDTRADAWTMWDNFSAS